MDWAFLERGVSKSTTPMQHTTDDLREGWARFLCGFRWDYVLTPTSRYPMTRAQFAAAVRAWLRRCGPRAYAALVLEHGKAGGLIHGHGLLGGIGRHPLRRTFLQQAWRRGNLLLEPYDPRRGWAFYLVKGRPIAVDLYGTLQPYRPRRGRAR